MNRFKTDALLKYYTDAWAAERARAQNFYKDVKDDELLAEFNNPIGKSWFQKDERQLILMVNILRTIFLLLTSGMVWALRAEEMYQLFKLDYMPFLLLMMMMVMMMA